jgi:hypothetical protein
MSGFYVVVECSDRKKLRFSGRLGEREAEYIAQLVWLRLRPVPRGGTAWGWRGELEHAVESTESEFVVPPSLGGVVRKALFPLLVVGAIVWLGLQTLHTQHARPQAEPTTPWRALPPVRRQPLRPEQQFADARSYASATTINLLRQSAQILGEVDCGAYPRWDDWECTVRARAVDGLYAGRAMLYFCKSESPPQTGGRVIRCGPKHPPRIDSRRLMPQPSEFADASAYAGAVTAYALRSGRVVLLTKPDCGDVVTWSSWTCTARARATIGPYAGRSLTYRCSLGGDRSVTCGPMNPPPI